MSETRDPSLDDTEDVETTDVMTEEVDTGFRKLRRPSAAEIASAVDSVETITLDEFDDD